MTATTACSKCGTPLRPADRFCASCGADISAQVSAAGETQKTPVPAASLSETSAQQAALLESLRHATLGEYEILAELGRGGMATVYLAQDLALGRKVALKVMSPALQFTEGMAERFKREARTAASLSHPNIIPIYAVKESEHVTYFVMKFIEGRGLDSIIKQVGPLPIPMVRTIASQVATALGHAHKRGIVHRDVKPANIMVDADGWAVVTDFGIAKVAETQHLTMTGATVGTPSYMSPEQCAARELSGASDQYSLGVVIYEMLAGRLLFSGDSIMAVMYAHLHEPPRPVRELRADAPTEVAAAVMRMLEKDPVNRWPSMEAAAAGLGGGPLAADDPIRTELMTLAAAGTAPKVLKRVSTPASVTPIGRREAGKTGGKTTVVAGLALEPARVTLTPGGAVQFTATVRAQKGAKQPARGVTWASTDADVLTVSESGLATAVAVGTATVTASLENSSATATVEVTPAHAGRRRLVWMGGAVLVAAAAGVWWTLRPSPAPQSAPPVADHATPVAVSPPPAADSVATNPAASAPAPAPPPADKSAPAPKNPVAARVEVTPGRVRVDVNRTFALRAVTRDDAGKVVRRPVGWATSDPDVATVSSAGVVTGVGAGKATITATSDRARSAPIEITVVAAPAPTPTGSGVLQVVIVPVWAYVSVDGTPRGQLTRFADSVSSGVPHHLYVQRDGFTTVDTSITIQPNEQRLVRIQMKQR